MKKFITVIIAILYFASSSGAAVRLHYCMDKLAGWSLSSPPSSNCFSCGMKRIEGKKKGCCRDEYKFSKQSAAHKITESSFQLSPAIATAILPVFIEAPAVHLPSVTEENPVGHGPPLITGVAVYIRNCVFLI